MKNITETISYNLAQYLIKSTDNKDEEFEVLKYGIFVFMHMLMACISTIIFGFITNTMFEIVTVSFIGAAMKRCSGGVHCSSPNRCIVTGIIMSYTFALIGRSVNYISIEAVYLTGSLILIHAFIILYKKCPVPSKNKPLKKEKTRKLLRKKAFNIYSICTIVFIVNIISNKFNIIYKFVDFNSLASCMVLGLYMQALSLTGLGSKCILLLDELLIKLKV